MPQQSMFGGWAVTGLNISVHLNYPETGGSVMAEVIDENGQRCERFTTRWQKDRDVTDIGFFLKAIAEAFLWGEAGAVSSVVRTGARAWLPELPSGK